ncbi:DNA-directed DNA polymerase epsilon, subunit B, partial [Coemansia thaxteri]
MHSLIYKVFTRKFSLSLQADALLYLSDVIKQNEMSQTDALKWLELLADTWTKREEGRPLVELAPLKDLVAAVVSGTSSGLVTATEPGDPATSSPGSDLFVVIDAFDVPAWWYDPGKKMFAQPFDSNDILSSAESKAALFRQRYDLLKQRVLRNENFMPVSFSDQEKDRFYTLSTIDSLQGREGEHFLLFGMLSQLEEGKLFLEDKAGSIQLDFSSLRETQSAVNGLFTESCFVLIDGYVEDGVLK